MAFPQDFQSLPDIETKSVEDVDYKLTVNEAGRVTLSEGFKTKVLGGVKSNKQSKDSPGYKEWFSNQHVRSRVSGNRICISFESKSSANSGIVSPINLQFKFRSAIRSTGEALPEQKQTYQFLTNIDNKRHLPKKG